MLELTDSFKALLIDTANALKGSTRRLFMARTVNELGTGGQRRAERELGWSRGTIRKGTHELESGVTCIDNFAARGRKRTEVHLLNLLTDITAIVDRQSQTDPQFRTNRLYTRLSAAEVRRQLIAHYGYTDDELPTAETIGAKLNALGYYPQKVAKTQPKKSPRNRRHLRAGEPGQSGCGRSGGGVTDLDGCESHRQSWPLRARRQESGRGAGCGPRFSAGSDSDPRGHFPARLG